MNDNTVSASSERRLESMLASMLKANGTDLYITADAYPSIKVDGSLTAISDEKISKNHVNKLVAGIMNEHQLAEFMATQECNFAIDISGLSRFRVNAFRQKNTSGMVLRTIHSDIPSLEQCQLPEVLKDIVMSARGLILIVGGTGSGKSTSMASMLSYRNYHSQGHIVTIEDPIEYIHQHQQCIITQREVGIDTQSYAAALKNTLRQAPDVIMLGEIRDDETMQYAMTFAETGHLCIATLHANSADQAIERILNFFPEEKRAQTLMDISMNLCACISQRLVRLQGGDGRVPACEILHNTPLISELIYKGELRKLKEHMSASKQANMKTFDQSLFELIQAGKISVEEGLRHADSINNLRLRCKLENSDDLKKGTEQWAVV